MLYPISDSILPLINKTLKKQPEEEIPQIQILRYMGNKRGLLNWLLPILKDELTYGDTILDLFAGTSSVGYALKGYARVIANDIQYYSSTISSALLEFNDSITSNDFNTDLLINYRKNYKSLLIRYGTAIDYESNLLAKQNVKSYINFCKKVPKIGYPVKNDIYNLNKYISDKYIFNRRKDHNLFPYCLFVTYFANTYFSLNQCITIDSLKYAIDQLSNEKRKTVYLTCLMFAINKAVNSSGHFAQFLNHNTHRNSLEIIELRKISIIDRFMQKLDEFRNIVVQDKWQNYVFNYDYQELIHKLKENGQLNRVKMIYIDPPYTTAQYSRFYHIPETLIKYDYPQLTKSRLTHKPVKGAYRNDRVQSKFSQIANAQQAFLDLFDIISSNTEATVVISYSDNSIIKPVDNLIDLASKYYQIIDKKNGHYHSAQGSRFKQNGKGNHIVNEYVLICKRK